MKNAPSRLGIFLLSIQITRVGLFLTHGLLLGWMGWFFAIALAAGVYVSAYFFGKTRGWAKVPGALGLVLFGLGDLWFNEMELIRTLSATDLVVETANFMNYSAEDIRWFLHISALIFGAFPTAGAAILGWQQSVSEGIEEFQQAGVISRIITAAGAVGVKYLTITADNLERRAGLALPEGEKPPLLEARNKEVRRWRSLTTEDIAWIGDPARGRQEIIYRYGVSDGAAGDWQRRIRAGERPWRDQ